MPTIEVALAARSYPVIVEQGALAHVAARLPLAGYTQLLLISEANLAPHLPALRAGLAGLPVIERILPACGERLKTTERWSALCESLLDEGIDRGAAVLAFGGGVVGDLAGFAAASLLRGLDWFVIPTTLLAMVDASIGGKTGVNAAAGKNLIGAFHQPRGVLADPAVLASLPPRERVAGLAEAVKTALLLGDPLLAQLEAAPLPALPDSQATAAIIAACAAAKGQVVANDERESEGQLGRKQLNLGHTVAHALEAAAGYGTWRHGEAVALGLAAAITLSERAAGLPPADAARARALLERLPLPPWPEGVDAAALKARLGADKKTLAGTVRWVLLEAIGRPVLTTCDEALVDAVLDEVVSTQARRGE